AYYLKEDLRQFWEQPDKATARNFLCDWIARAEASKILVLQKFFRLLRAYRFGLLAWYDHPISTAALEGTNNKIKTSNAVPTATETSSTSRCGSTPYTKQSTL
ncbi:MAG: transposase, partial [Planctomycetaceae bacterium]